MNGYNDYLEKISYLYMESTDRKNFKNPISAITVDHVPISLNLRFSSLMFNLYKDKKYEIVVELFKDEDGDETGYFKEDFNYELDLNQLASDFHEETASTKITLTTSLGIQAPGRYKYKITLRDQDHNDLDQKSTYFEIVHESVTYE